MPSFLPPSAKARTGPTRAPVADEPVATEPEAIRRLIEPTGRR